MYTQSILRKIKPANEGMKLQADIANISTQIRLGHAVQVDMGVVEV